MSYTLIFEIFCVFPPCFFSSLEFLFSLRDESDDGLEFPDEELVPECNGDDVEVDEESDHQDNEAQNADDDDDDDDNDGVFKFKIACGGPPMAPGGGNATIFEEGGSGNGSGGAGGGRGGVGGGGEVEVEEFRFEDI
ncbi:hypothetical protein RhiirA4_474164 [Rhizophagus irregularis]|uniref:Uncharacterized protein n=1 Tax=Rhizophagus irregularis TaxID=588596 RepID=A0A2I1H806_9GLOM|nr:hypothetical protein RhiirA4_474164 [Rhizophagus irregularis]